MDCQEVYKRLQDYLDRELSPEEIEQVKGHLGKCDPCAEEYRFEDSFLRHVKRCLCEADVPQELANRLKAALDQQS